MGTAFEVALICDLKPNLSPQIVNTLNYLTRSQDYDFQVAIEHPFFENEFGEEWRNIIANNHLRTGEEDSAQTCRSLLDRNQLCFRVLLDDDTYCNVGFFFLDWLALLSSTQGLVGYRVDIIYLEYNLIYFRNGKVREFRSTSTEVSDSFMQSIDTQLGGSSYIAYLENEKNRWLSESPE